MQNSSLWFFHIQQTCWLLEVEPFNQEVRQWNIYKLLTDDYMMSYYSITASLNTITAELPWTRYVTKLTYRLIFIDEQIRTFTKSMLWWIHYLKTFCCGNLWYEVINRTPTNNSEKSDYLVSIACSDLPYCLLKIKFINQKSINA